MAEQIGEWPWGNPAVCPHCHFNGTQHSAKRWRCDRCGLRYIVRNERVEYGWAPDVHMSNECAGGGRPEEARPLNLWCRDCLVSGYERGLRRAWPECEDGPGWGGEA